MEPTPHPDRSSRGARGLINRLWQASPPLTAVSALMLAAAVASAIGLAVDPRIITGAPAWLKPLKFAVSTAVYGLTLAWIFTYLPDRQRMRRIVGWTTAIVFVLEVGIIDVQAWRGTTSHFNASTPLDQSLFAVMGAAIVLQTLVSIAVVVAVWRHRFADRSLGWALRFGTALTIAGALTGGLMTRPTEAQLSDLRAGGHPTSIGAHTVGGVDGGPGMPLTGWSREHGDVRVPHFVGLHAIQALALVAFGLRRWRRSEGTRVKAVLVAGASYTALFGVLLWHALHGHSVVASSAAALVPFGLWAASTALAFGVIGGTHQRASTVAAA